MIDLLKRAPWWLWLLIVAVLYLLSMLGDRRRNPTAQRALQRMFERAQVRARAVGARAEQALTILSEMHRQEDEQIAQSKAEAKRGAAKQHRGPGRRRWPLLLICSAALPWGAALGQTPVMITELAALEAEVPGPVLEGLGPCMPGTGRWVIHGRSACWPCPPPEIYAEGAGDLPEGCPAPAPGVWVELEAFNTSELDTAGLQAQVRATQLVLSDTRRREERCLRDLETLANEMADAMKPCAEVAQVNEGHSLAAVAGVGLVGAAVGLLVGALAL